MHKTENNVKIQCAIYFISVQCEEDENIYFIQNILNIYTDPVARKPQERLMLVTQTQTISLIYIHIHLI